MTKLLLKIGFVLIAGFLVQYLLSISTWFDYGDADTNWLITDLSRVCRILVLTVSIIVAVRFIIKGIWGLWIFTLDIGSNIFTVLSDYGVIDKLDYEIFWVRKSILLIAFAITFYQINKRLKQQTKEEQNES